MSPDDPLPTGELAAAASGAPRERFAELYACVAPAVLVWARLQIRAPLRSRLEPEDVLQETVLRAWQRFAEFDPARASFRSWMFGFARNVLFEALQRAAAPAVVGPLTTGGLARVPDDTTSVTRSVARRESLARFSSHVAALPREEQRLLMYRGLEERSHEEVAALLQTTPDAAAKRWSRLRERLASELGGGEFLAA